MGPWGNRQRQATWIVASVLGLTTVSAALQAPPLAEIRASSSRLPKFGPITTRQILISIPDRKLALLEDGKIVRIYRVAVGKTSTPSPVGEFRIVNRVSNPTYYHQGQIIAAGKGNPVGTRWMGLSAKGYGIHGTNQPHSIGKAASTGCIRMGKRDLEELFAMVASGDAVQIRAERDEEIAAVFGRGSHQEMVASNTIGGFENGKIGQ